jgi:alanine racemase
VVFVPSPTLEINLAAITRNYMLLKNKLTKGNCASVVKANAYGLGVEQVAPALAKVGCKEFFVATLDEGIQLRKILTEGNGRDIKIYIFHGVRKGQLKDFISHNLIPVINDKAQLEHWSLEFPYALHVDTGMCRLGVTPEEALGIGQGACLILSHLACANEPEHPKNKEQLELFKQALQHFPNVRASFANSSGIFLGSDYHFDLARPGCSLYGVSPNSSQRNPMENVITLSAPILQYRAITHNETVGYSAAGRAKKGDVLATVELGYADGFLRSLSGKAYGYAAGIHVPLIGRISMDMVIVDVTAVPEHLCTPELRIVFIGEEQPVDVLAKAAGTIGYEIFTGLGDRFKRSYI